MAYSNTDAIFANFYSLQAKLLCLIIFDIHKGIKSSKKTVLIFSCIRLSMFVII